MAVGGGQEYGQLTGLDYIIYLDLALVSGVLLLLMLQLLLEPLEGRVVDESTCRVGERVFVKTGESSLIARLML